MDEKAALFPHGCVNVYDVLHSLLIDAECPKNKVRWEPRMVDEGSLAERRGSYRAKGPYDPLGTLID